MSVITITFTCTGRGSHKRKVLGDLSYVEADDMLVPNTGRAEAHAADSKKKLITDHEVELLTNDQSDPSKPSWLRVQVSCPSCPAKPQWTKQNAVKLLEVADAQGLTEFDISFA